MTDNKPFYLARVPFEISREDNPGQSYVVITFEGESIVKLPIRNGTICQKIPLVSLHYILSNAGLKGYSKLKSFEANLAFRIIFGNRIEKVLKRVNS